MKWIYLKGNDNSDALALATVLSHTTEKYGIVRKSVLTIYLKGLSNVEIGYYEQNGTEQCIVTLDCSHLLRWNEKCAFIARTIAIEIDGFQEPYLGFIEPIEPILDYWVDGAALLYLKPYPDQNLDLMVVDRLTKLYAKDNVRFVTAGSSMMPCIKATHDFRELIGINEICLLRKRISFIFTSEPEIVTIASAFNIPTFLISAVDEMRVDGIPMSDANQIYNYTSTIINKNIQ